MRRKYGPKTAAAIEAFRKRCANMVSPIEYYEGVGAHDNEHPWAYITCEELLDREVTDPMAKRFFKTDGPNAPVRNPLPCSVISTNVTRADVEEKWMFPHNAIKVC